VSDLIVWNIALSKEQIDDIYRSGHPSTAPVDIALSLLISKSSNDADLTAASILEEQLSEVSAVPGPQENNDLTNILSHGIVDSESSVSSFHEVTLSGLLTEIQSFKEDCKVPLHRKLDIYAQAATLGHIESLFHWSMLLLFGSETSKSNCGIQEFFGSSKIKHNDAVLQYEEFSGSQNCKLENVDNIKVSDQVIAAFALITALDNGYMAASLPLSTLIGTGIGVLPLLYGYDNNTLHDCYRYRMTEYIVQHTPLPVRLFMTRIHLEGEMNVAFDDHIATSYKQVYSINGSLFERLHQFVTSATNSCLEKSTITDSQGIKCVYLFISFVFN
jgi:hypothetical protein